MNQDWNSMDFNFRQGYFQGNHSSQRNENSYTCNTKAYLNPQIVNYELIKRSLLSNPIQGGSKIHVNPNFKGSTLNNLSNYQHSINTPFLNSQNTLLRNPGTSAVENDESRNSSSMCLSKSLSSAALFPKQTDFKNINTVYQTSGNKYSWHKNVIDKPDSHAKNSGTISPTKTMAENCCTFNNNQIKYKFASPKKINYRTCQNPVNRKIFKSATKIINESKANCASFKTKFCSKKKKNHSPYKKLLLLTRYEYNKNKSSVLNVAKAVRSKYKFLSNLEHHKKSKYKIDKRDKLMLENKKESNLEVKDIRKLFPNYLYNKLKLSPYNIYNLQNHQTSVKKKYTWRKSQLLNKKNINQFSSKKVVKIGGILYKSTSNKLTLANKNVDSRKGKSITDKSKAKKIHVLYVRGEKFILENNGKALRRQFEKSMNEKTFLLTPKRIDIGGVTYIQKSKNVLIRTNVHEARHLVNKAKNKSIALLTNLYKRSSMPCMIYHKFGKCTRHTKGLCMYKHDPKNIAVCKKFLQGNCNSSNCLLSHQTSLEKMATCYFFLKGLCFRDNCPFLHVKLNKNAEICENFLQGFCSLGKECSKRHLHMCPKFDKFGTCNQGSECHYPHKKLKEVEVTPKQNKADAINEVLNKQNEIEHLNILEKPKKSKKIVTKLKNLNSKTRKKATKKKSLCLNNSDQNNEVVECFPKRIKLDKLPCYIPLISES